MSAADRGTGINHSPILALVVVPMLPSVLQEEVQRLGERVAAAEAEAARAGAAAAAAAEAAAEADALRGAIQERDQALMAVQAEQQRLEARFLERKLFRA